jgi:drug/metabolite transporter (DMT)-like permease
MDGRYWLGAFLAVAAGVVFNAGILMQKIAVGNSEGGAGLMRRLVKSPLWMWGLVVQIAVGSPMNMLALSLIGPVIIPGLSSIGLVVLALGAVRFAGERLRVGEIAGIGLVMAAVTVFGLGGMSVNMREAGLYETAFLVRLSVFSAVLALLSLTCYGIARRTGPSRGVLRTVNAGLLFALSNLWLGVLTELLSQWIRDRFALTHFPYIFIASAIVAGTSYLGIAETQHAFESGDASKLIPIQNVPSQILPVAAYFLVFSLRPADSRALPLTLLGVVLVLAGAFLLAGRQMAQAPTGRLSAAAARNGK